MEITPKRREKKKPPTPTENRAGADKKRAHARQLANLCSRAPKHLSTVAIEHSFSRPVQQCARAKATLSDGLVYLRVHSSPLNLNYSAPLLRASDSVGLCSDGQQIGRSCTTVWPAFVKRSRSSTRLPDTFRPSFRSSSPVSIYRRRGKAGSCQKFAREAALSMGGETRFSSSKSPAVWPKKKGAGLRMLLAWPARRGEGVHEIGTANFVLGGAPGKGKGGAACTILARRVLLVCDIGTANFVLEGDGLEHGGGHGIWPGSSVHEISTANFVFDGAAVPREGAGLGMVLACGQRRKGNVREIGKANFVLGGGRGKGKGGAHEIGKANFVLDRAPLACGKKQGAALTKSHSESRVQRCSWHVERGAGWGCSQRVAGGEGAQHGEFRAQRCSWHV